MDSQSQVQSRSLRRRMQRSEIVSLRTERPQGYQSPYTSGAKKTKKKISWGTSSPESGSTTSLCQKRPDASVAFQSRWYVISGSRRFCIRLVDGFLVYRCYQDQTRELVAKIHESGLVWERNIGMGDPIIGLVEQFFGIVRNHDRDYYSSEFGRLSMVKPLTDLQKETTRKQARKARSRQRPSKRDRLREKQRQQSGKTLRLFD